jgi:hypothetical protein
MTEHCSGPAQTLNSAETGPTSKPPASPPPSDVQGNIPHGRELEDELLQACNHRLIDVNWFCTDWQRSGASTGKGLILDEDLKPHNVVIKLPVPQTERLWLVRLAQTVDVVPRIYFHGDKLGQYDINWIVMEYLPHGPLSKQWDGIEFDLLVEAYGRLAKAMSAYPVDEQPPQKDWEVILQKSRDMVHAHSINDEQRWGKALKKAHRKLKGWLTKLEDEPQDHWCHGDLHFGNALCRDAPPQGPALLIDFACVHAGHWLTDAIYFEHLFWARRDMLNGRKLCSMIAKERKKHGLKVCAEWPQWAQIRRGLLAMSTPAMLEHDGSPLHVQAALEVLEASL